MERLRRSGRDLGQAVAERPRPGASAGRTGESLLAPATGQAGGDGGAQQGLVQVISGASVQSFPIVGVILEHARTLLGSFLHLDPRGPVLVNGRPVSSDHRLAANDVVEFVHHAGEKGVIHARPDRDH
jgi:hypothetical protein